MAEPFPRMSYIDCMDLYGSDKPDLRIPNTVRLNESICTLNHLTSQIVRLTDFANEDFVRMITKLEDPTIEAWKVSLNSSADEIRKFIVPFMDNLPAFLSRNPDGSPQVLIYDPRKPLSGFASLGPDGSEVLTASATKASGLQSLEEGDVVVFQARENVPHHGGSTKLGTMRTALYNAAISSGLLTKPQPSWRFLWVTDFPLFSPYDGSDPGQGGASGFSSTHHPFTAPLTPDDFDLLFTDPLKAKADHYDLVLNGAEIGGGSRRIHVASIQEFIFRDILKMGEERIDEFAHLLRCLGDGCAPHAGFAFGIDRLCAVLTDTSTIRDVIAFPKSMKGEDLLTKTPGKLTDEQLEPYHLQMRRSNRTG
jgi:aspartyl-tRNA synthetase